MTDRYNSLTVIFKEEIRDDDLEKYINAFSLFHNVIDVQLSNLATTGYIARTQERSKLIDELRGVLYYDRRREKS